MAHNKVEISIDGLLAIAISSDLVDCMAFSDGKTAEVTLRTSRGNFTDQFTLSDATTDGSGKGPVWEKLPDTMLRVYAIKKSLRKHFSTIIEQAEKEMKGQY